MTETVWLLSRPDAPDYIVISVFEWGRRAVHPYRQDGRVTSTVDRESETKMTWKDIESGPYHTILRAGVLGPIGRRFADQVRRRPASSLPSHSSMCISWAIVHRQPTDEKWRKFIP
jgi:hypothetical protein